VVGNIKTYFNPKITSKYKKNKPLIVLASTHRGEEEMILKHIDTENYQVVVVPRHPERFDEVYEMMKRFGSVVKFSEMRNGKWKNRSVKELEDFMLADVMGELVNLYAVADVVILGGSFVDNVGGHNPIEAAYFNTPIISGRYIFNQKALYDEVEGIEICDVDQIKDKLKSANKTKIKNRIDLEKIISFIKE
jgi:3-deoxy-D-manno-octulosonic-acid transferase